MTSIYSGLPLQGDDLVRLLSIDKRRSDGTFELSMTTRKFSDRPHYHALSYTWRNPLGLKSPPDEDDRQKKIICNGHVIPVLPNLYSALTVLASSQYRNDLFWIDALCINQRDDAEKAAQVARMPTLYRCADTVLLFLGPRDEGDSAAMALIRTIGSMTEANRKALDPLTLHGPQSIDLLGSEGSQDQAWKYLAQFFCRSYFSRAWVVQEILHASSLVAFCGNEQLEWMHVVKTSEMLSTSDWNEVFSRESIYGSDRVKAYHGGPAKLRATRFQRSGEQEDILLYSLIRGRGFHCSDPRDKVFSILSTSKLQQPIDYKLTKEDVYLANAKLILEARQDLLLLGHVEGSDNTNFKRPVPSWVPDWSTTATLGLGVTGYKRFDATKNKTCHLDIDGTILEVKGEHVDTVKMVGEIKADVANDTACVNWLRLINSWKNEEDVKFEAMWRVLTTSTSPLRAKDQHDTCFIHWLARHLKPHLARQDQVSGDLVQELQKLTNYQPSTTEAAGFHMLGQKFEINHYLADRFASHYRHSSCLRLFSTESQNLGTGSTSLRAGDQIFLLYGSRIPLILRRTASTSRNEYTLVGGCFLNNAMHGELLDKSAEQTIHII